MFNNRPKEKDPKIIDLIQMLESVGSISNVTIHALEKELITEKDIKKEIIFTIGKNVSASEQGWLYFQLGLSSSQKARETQDKNLATIYESEARSFYMLGILLSTQARNYKQAAIIAEKIDPDLAQAYTSIDDMLR